MLDLVAELQGVASTLRAGGVEFALCGGLAVAVHGHVRATRDIDLLIRSADRDKALASLKSAGFDLLAAPMTFDAGTPAERNIQRVSKVVGGHLVTVDLIFVEPAFGRVWATRLTFERDGTTLVVVSRDGLIEMKRLAARAQDMADIEALERASADD
ncbi:MAG: nucleotidyl transferase AbiEii/AbiGii toxin family protein [Myxococcota bacterium]|nr:nucleotidyl transferase AbiEii/AbiGii toxin family protein [Myxococcota bacterium]